MLYDMFEANDPMYDDADEVAYYMNPETGSVDTYDGWWYKDENGDLQNGVDEGVLIKVNRIKGDDGLYYWEEA